MSNNCEWCERWIEGEPHFFDFTLDEPLKVYGIPLWRRQRRFGFFCSRRCMKEAAETGYFGSGHDGNQWLVTAEQAAKEKLEEYRKGQRG